MSSKISFQLIADFHDENVIIAYQGAFDNIILTILAQNIEDKLTDERTRRKLFKIFLELAQNVSFYSAERKQTRIDPDLGMGIFIIKEYPNFFTIATGNLTKKTTALIIQQHIEKINSFDRGGLRKYKRERRSLPHGAKGGANIGLIQVALTSENDIEFKSVEIDSNNTFIAIATKINK